MLQLSKMLNLIKAMGVIALPVILFISQTNETYAHQPFEIIKSPSKKTTIDLSDASVSHAFYGKFESVNEEIIFNLNNFSDNILKFSILIPDRNPEKLLDKKYLPELTLTKISTSKNQNSPNVQNTFKPNITPATYYEPYSQMHLIRVTAHQEILKNNIQVKVTIKSNGPLRYIFSVGSKEIFSSVYASGDTEYFNSSSQREWYWYIENENENEDKDQKNLPKKITKPSVQIQNSNSKQLENTRATANTLNSTIVIFSSLILLVVIILIIYYLKYSKKKYED